MTLPAELARYGSTWQRATTSASCARMSTSFPLPSSPHCPPKTTVTPASSIAMQAGQVRGAKLVLAHVRNMAGCFACEKCSCQTPLLKRVSLLFIVLSVILWTAKRENTADNCIPSTLNPSGNAEGPKGGGWEQWWRATAADRCRQTAHNG